MSTDLRQDDESVPAQATAGSSAAADAIDGGDPPPGEEPLADRDDDIVAAAEAEAEELRDDNQVLGTPGPPVNRRSPFMIGLLGAAGVAVTYGLVQLTVVAASILGLIGLALFLAVGLEPAVAWLARRRVPRGAAVLLVSLAIIAVVVAFLGTAMPLLTAQVEAFVTNLPTYVTQMTEHSASVRRLDERFQIQRTVAELVKTGNPSLTAGLLTAGKAV